MSVSELLSSSIKVPLRPLVPIESFLFYAPSLSVHSLHPEQLLTAIKYQAYGGQSGQSGQQAGYGQYNPYEQQQDNRYENYSNQNQGAGYGGGAQQPYSTRPEPQQTNSSYYGDPEAGAVNSHGMFLSLGSRRSC